MALSVLKCLRFVKNQKLCQFGEKYGGGVIACTYVTNIEKDPNFEKLVSSWDSSLKKDRTSRAMKVYLQRAKEHDEFMKKQQISYQLGKRHLANMMGEDPETFTQDMVDESITYLFPSGIFDRAARPILKPPEIIFPSKKEAEFDNDGRPFHPFFYTGKPVYFKVLFDVRTHMEDLKKYHNDLLIKKAAIDPDSQLDVSGSVWVNMDELSKILIETVNDLEYKIFISAFDRLVNLPYSKRCKDFIFQYRKPLVGQKKALDVPLPLIDENGRSYVTTYECLRKSARGQVTVRSPGTGLISINGQDITYFRDKQSRQQLLFPLIFTELLNSVDVECQVDGGGYSGQAGALRWGIATSLRSFVDPEMVEKMRIAGLLTRDYRKRERKLPGQKGARAKFTWKKR